MGVLGAATDEGTGEACATVLQLGEGGLQVLLLDDEGRLVGTGEGGLQDSASDEFAEEGDPQAVCAGDGIGEVERKP